MSNCNANTKARLLQNICKSKKWICRHWKNQDQNWERVKSTFVSGLFHRKKVFFVKGGMRERNQGERERERERERWVN